MRTTRTTFRIGLLAAALLCGCRSAPDAPARPPLPPQTAAPSASPVRQASARVDAPPVNEPGKPAGPKEKIDLPTAVQLCTLQNFRLQASATKIAQAQGDLITASLIPNPSLYTDLQLIPLQRANLQNQLGPPQQDAIFTIPIDWLVFGKRAAAMQAQQLGVSVARADQDDAIRRAVSQTVDTFYAVLQAEALVKLAEEEYADAQTLQAAVAKQAAAGKAGAAETGRVRLQVMDAQLAVGTRESEMKAAKAKLRPLIGRTAADPDFDVVGTLEVRAVVPAPELAEAIALAEAHRPDLLSDRHALARAAATVHLEQRRAKPAVAITPGWSYQYQRSITGFRNGSMLDVGVQFGLPLTDRNQGNIHKAQAQLAETRYTHLANVADVRAEVEAVVAAYADAVDDVTKNSDPATLTAAAELRRAVDADFLAGGRRLPEVFDARRVSADRRARHIEFQATYWRALNRLNTVVGLAAYDPATAKTVPVEYGKGAEPGPKKK